MVEDHHDMRNCIKWSHIISKIEEHYVPALCYFCPELPIFFPIERNMGKLVHDSTDMKPPVFKCSLSQYTRSCQISG